MTLEHISCELYNRHPATGRYVYSTNDFDMMLRDTLGPYNPPGIGSAAIRQTFLKIEGTRSITVITEEERRSH